MKSLSKFKIKKLANNMKIVGGNAERPSLTGFLDAKILDDTDYRVHF